MFSVIAIITLFPYAVIIQMNVYVDTSPHTYSITNLNPNFVHSSSITFIIQNKAIYVNSM